MYNFEYYFIDRNGLWKERIEEYKRFGGIQCSSIAKLIMACELGHIDQHASEDLKAVSSVIAAQQEEIGRLNALLKSQEAAQ